MSAAPAWPYPRVIAHRGGGSLAPENTFAALRTGASRGFRGVEFDVMLAGDGTPVLIHDETLERTTGAPGEVAAKSYAELAVLDAGAWKGAQWRGEHIPRFEDAAKLCRELGLWANVEIKPAAGHDAATGSAAAGIAAAVWRDAPLQPLLSSFSAEALDAARRSAPELPRGHLFDAVPADWRARLESHGCAALHCNWRSLDATLCARIHAAGYAILAWTVNDVTLARTLFAWGVNAIFTDALEEIGPELA